MALPESSPIHLIWDANGAGAVSNQNAHTSPMARGSSLKAHKQLPRRRDLEDGTKKSKTRYIIKSEHGGSSAEEEAAEDNSLTKDHSLVTRSSANPVLPLTPPTAHEEETEVKTLSPVTPPPQQSPPTPEITPPRPRFLGAQPSFVSTKAESFRTAREEFISDDEDDSSRFGSPHPFRHLLATPLPNGHLNGHDPLAEGSSVVNGITYEDLNLYEDDLPRDDGPETPRLNGASPVHVRETPELARSESSLSSEPIPREILLPTSDYDLPQIHTDAHTYNELTPREIPLPASEYDLPSTDTKSPLNDEPTPRFEDETSPKYSELPQRGLSLRDRLVAQPAHSSSTEQFANSIGWPADQGSTSSNRASGVSNTSVVEAMVYDTPPKRRQTLRHIHKNDSLRSTSSPIPARSNRDSSISSPDSPHTLHRKKARLSNHNRWSYGSEVSRSFSVASSGVLPRSEHETIKVAVIPERASSLKSSANSSQRHSVALSHGSGDDYYPPNSYHSRDRSDFSYRRRSASDSLSPSANRARQTSVSSEPEAPMIPPRKSSLSAPTSASNSRTSSLTSKSDHHRRQRKAAEKDLRKTLDRMESERLIPKLQALSSPDQREVAADGVVNTPGAEPGSARWASLRPTSVLDTPFSQPSVMSASPGPVEMGEARTVNYFPHNNDSLQLIEKHPQSESSATRKARQLIANEPKTPSTTYDSNRNSRNVVFGNTITSPTTHHSPLVDSPLRNPREPPTPPRFEVIPPSPAALNRKDHQLGQHSSNGEKVQGRSRPSTHKRHRSESFVKSLTRNFSNARNKKEGQELDSNLHPFWRPRGFWDGMNESDDEEMNQGQSRSLVNNSLGIPQERTVISGPISLMRSLSDSSRRRRRNRDLINRSSHSSLQKLRASHRLYKIPVLGAQFRFIGLRDLQDRMTIVKQRKEDERRERRREDLRRSIGANVISQGDSRFPASMVESPARIHRAY